MLSVSATRLHRYEICARVGDEYKLVVVAASSRKAAERVAEWVRSSGEFVSVRAASMPGAGWRKATAMWVAGYACIAGAR